MSLVPIPGFWIGFALFCVGGAARAYMDFAAHGKRVFYDLKRGNTEVNYWRLVKVRRAPVWPLFVSSIGILLGFATAFGSIIWHNHLRH